MRMHQDAGTRLFISLFTHLHNDVLMGVPSCELIWANVIALSVFSCSELSCSVWSSMCVRETCWVIHMRPFAFAYLLDSFIWDFRPAHSSLLQFYLFVLMQAITGGESSLSGHTNQSGSRYTCIDGAHIYRYMMIVCKKWYFKWLLHRQRLDLHRFWLLLFYSFGLRHMGAISKELKPQNPHTLSQ